MKAILTKTHKWSQTEKDQLAELSNYGAEQMVVSTVLGLQHHALELIIPTGLDSAMFFYPFHRAIFSAALALYLEKKPIETTSLKEWLKAKKIYTEEGLEKNFTAEYIRARDVFCPLQDVANYALVVREYDIRRKFWKMCQKGAKDAFDTGKDVFDLTSDLGTKSLEISDPALGKDSESLSKAIEQRLDDLQNKPKKGILTGIDELDAVLLGLMPSEYTILGARPSVGKTSFLTHLYVEACNQGKKALFFNLEMGHKVFTDRVLSYLSNVPIYSLRKHQLSDKDWEAIYKSTAFYLKEDCRVVSEGGLSINDIVVRCRKIQARFKLDIIFIDYIQLIASPKSSYHQNREQELAGISKALKKLALDLKIHVVCAAQLNREVDNRAGHRPRTSDLRESGSMEQDADNILLLNRLERYGITQDERGNPTEGRLDIIVAKQRNGECKDVSAEFDGRLSKVKQGYRPKLCVRKRS